MNAQAKIEQPYDPKDFIADVRRNVINPATPVSQVLASFEALVAASKQFHDLVTATQSEHLPEIMHSDIGKARDSAELKFIGDCVEHMHSFSGMVAAGADCDPLLGARVAGMVFGNILGRLDSLFTEMGRATGSGKFAAVLFHKTLTKTLMGCLRHASGMDAGPGADVWHQGTKVASGGQPPVKEPTHASPDSVQ